MTYTVTKEDAGIVVREFLRAHGVTARCLRRLKETHNGITLNGAPCTVRALLREGDKLALLIEETPAAPLAPLSPVPVLYEDEWLIVFDKPAGMPTHQSAGHRGDTLADAILGLPGAPTVFRAVNRLDLGTSGVVLVARHQQAAGFLSACMAAGRIQKEYLAIIDKPLSPASGLMTDHIAREGDSIIRRMTVPRGMGDYAEAAYQTVSAHDQYILVRLYPRTGRTHQLRVQLSSRGSPIVGDDLYGGSPDLPRAALHAARLTFPHPNGGAITVEAPLPEDMCRIFNKEGV